MKNLLEYIQKKHIQHQHPCLQLFTKLTDEEVEAIDTIANDFLEYYEDTMVTYDEKHMSVSTFFKEYAQEDTTNLFLVLAYMLASDGDFEYWKRIGLKGYSGNQNPYDFSCFEEETDDNTDVLDYIRNWLCDKDNEYKFSFVFAGVRKNMKKFESASDFLDALIDVLR